MHKPFFKYASYATLGLAMLLILTLIFWAAYPYKTYVQKYQPTPIQSDTVKAGESVTLLLDYCNYSATEHRSVRRLVGDNSKIVLSDTVRPPSPTGCDSKPVEVPIPKATAPGTYTIEFTITSYVNPIRTIPVTFSSAPFSVIK